MYTIARIIGAIALCAIVGSIVISALICSLHMFNIGNWLAGSLLLIFAFVVVYIIKESARQ